VRNGCSIGANATIICGLEQGSYFFIVAVAVVTRKVKNFSCVSGIPAKKLYWISKCGKKLFLEIVMHK
jgi:UDP-2-acetamido-3-amino-2,3-dideoxy-glucuronate N-acetyltransferase